jgi:hypothetical protein
MKKVKEGCVLHDRAAMSRECHALAEEGTRPRQRMSRLYDVTIATTASPNYEPVLALLLTSLEHIGFTGQVNVHRTPPLAPPFGAFTASYHAAIMASMSHLLSQLEAASEGAFVIKTDADIQFFSPFCDAFTDWAGQMCDKGLDVLLMQEGMRHNEANGGFYVIRVSTRSCSFFRELVRRCAAIVPSYVEGGTGPKMFDQFHLNSMLGLQTGVEAWDPSFRFSFIPASSIIWGDDIGCGRDLRTPAFHHAISLHGVPEKLVQMTHVAAAVRLRGPGSRLVAALNARTTELRGGRVALLPYRPCHVPAIHGWLQQEGMRQLLGHEEPWSTLAEEEHDQVELSSDPTRVGMVIVHTPEAATAGAIPSGDSLCGDLSASLTLCALEELCDFEVREDGVRVATGPAEHFESLNPLPDQPPLAMELDIMLGSEAARNIGLATEALQLFLSYVATCLPELRHVSAKLHEDNHVAKRFFERNGMHVHKHSPLLRQTEMRLHRADFPMWSTLYKSHECK